MADPACCHRTCSALLGERLWDGSLAREVTDPASLAATLGLPFLCRTVCPSCATAHVALHFRTASLPIRTTTSLLVIVTYFSNSRKSTERDKSNIKHSQGKKIINVTRNTRKASHRFEKKQHHNQTNTKLSRAHLCFQSINFTDHFRISALHFSLQIKL